MNYNIYCDESCHLKAYNPEQNAMVLGAVWCPQDNRLRIAGEIRAIKERYGYKPDFEIKWVNVSRVKLPFYLDILNYFFREEALRFRAVVIPDKTILHHEDFGQSHDDWYYKMYYLLLDVIVENQHAYNIYLDIKDSKSYSKVAKLAEYLKNRKHDWDSVVILNIQHVRSHEVEHIQLVDLLIGAVGYANRGLRGNTAKVAVVETLSQLAGLSLTVSTPLSADKVNILRWDPSKKEGTSER